MIKSVKKILNKLYNDLFYDRGMVALLSEYAHMSKKEVLWLLKNGGRINNDLWVMLNPKNDQEKKHFYEVTPFYVFELLWWHMTRYQKQFRRAILAEAQGNVLDFGGGPGDLSLALARRDLQVDYADVEGNTFNFAKWLFQKNAVRVTMINLSKEEVTQNYDTIICIDVIEHMPNAKEFFAKMVFHLNPRGKFIITNLTVDEESIKNHPMHEKVNLDDSYLASLGLEKTDKKWLLIKK